MENIEKFKQAFAEIRDRGFIKSNRTGNTGIGKTLEDILKIEENNIDAPDLHGFEIKGQRAFTGSYVTLFTRAPTWPKAANTLLREAYGTPDRKATHMKVLHTSLFADKFNTHKSGYGFKLDINTDEEKIFLVIKNLETDKIEDLSVYWSFEVISTILSSKLNHLVFIRADTEKRADGEYFDFNRADMYIGTSIEKFLKLLVEGKVQFDIRIGVYRQGSNAGKTHDHGSGFRLRKANFSELFDEHEVL